MEPRSIIFVRHAQSIGNIMTQDERANYEIPNHAYPLTDIGGQQAILTGKYLKDELSPKLPDIFLTSTFLRTQMTMDLILKELRAPVNLTPIIDSRLDEKWDGIFHELSRADVERLYPEQIKLRKLVGYYHHRAPGGESCPDVEIKIRNLLSDPIIAGKRLLAVGHGRWFVIFQKVIHNLSVDEFLQLKDQGSENCSVTEYLFENIPKSPSESFVPWKGYLEEQKTELA